MSTRARIGLELKNGNILSVYHHSDSYPKGIGVDLKNHYNTRELAAQLIDGGDMSCAWTDRRWCSDEKHEYGANYYSYRGEDCPPRLDANLTEYLCNGEEYAYLYRRGQWVCYDLHGQFPEIVEIPSDTLAI